jgi:hypothetical protein
MNNNKIRNTIYIQEGPKAYLKILDQCGNGRNDGMICYVHGHIWLKNDQASPRYLIREIRSAGGEFTGQGFIPLPNGRPNCTSGSSYEGGRLFESVESAISYLKKYFIVLACATNTEWTQMKIEEI